MGVASSWSKLTCEDVRACMFSLPLMSTMLMRQEVATNVCYHTLCSSIRPPLRWKYDLKALLSTI